MSIYNYFKSSRSKPIVNSNVRQQSNITVAEQQLINEEIARISPSKKRDRCGVRYNFDERLQIANYARMKSPYAASKKFKCHAGSARSYRDILNRYLKVNKAKAKAIGKLTPSDIPQLSPKKGGRPSYLSKKLIKKVVDTVKGLRSSGVPVNTHVIAGTLGGILRANDPGKLEVNGGFIDAMIYAKTFKRYRLQNFSYRAATAKRRPTDDKRKEINKWRASVNFMRHRYRIPGALMGNLDETFSNYVPIGNYSFAVRGTQHVRVAGIGDKRGISHTMACWYNGAFSALQTVYGGKTMKCLPNLRGLIAPHSWCLDYTKNHWCNLDTAKRYINDVIITYVDDVKNELLLEKEQVALLTMDGWYVHRDPDYNELMASEYVYRSICPFGATDQCNALDVGINKIWKAELRKHFVNYLALCYEYQKEQGVSDDNIKYDLKLSTIKNKHLNWQVKAWEHINSKPDIISNSMKSSLCLPVYNERRESERWGIPLV